MDSGALAAFFEPAEVGGICLASDTAGVALALVPLLEAAADFVPAVALAVLAEVDFGVVLAGILKS
ncbi:MAG: hypothetical protein SNJ52_01090 [Verrucomicrobiia bacterium]